MCFKRKFNPDLIDLDEYERNLYFFTFKNHLLGLPPPSIHDRLDKEWSREEMQAMRENRKKAEEIYDRVASELPTKHVKPEFSEGMSAAHRQAFLNLSEEWKRSATRIMRDEHLSDPVKNALVRCFQWRASELENLVLTGIPSISGNLLP